MISFDDMRKIMGRLLLLLLVCASCGLTQAQQRQKQPRRTLIRDIATVAGVRDNPLIGYGIVVGLHGTGDSQQTVFTTQALAAAMQKFGVQVSPQSVRVYNVAGVFITASLPPFARPGVALDVTVSSAGDAKSLEGGVLILAALKGTDGQTYAEAQGPLTLGGYSVGANGSFKTVNHLTVARIPNGALVERDTAVDLNTVATISLMLRDPDFTTSRNIAEALNEDMHRQVAKPIDSRRVDVDVKSASQSSVTVLISRIQNVAVDVRPPAKVVINERTGTIVMGGDVTLSAVAVFHGSLSIEVTTSFDVSQTTAFSSGGTTTVVPETKISAHELPAKTIRMAEGASVEELINGLRTIGATPRDIVAVIQAIKAAGGLQAELEVI